MLLKINSKGQVTLPVEALEALGVGPGDELELQEAPIGYLLRPKRIKLSEGEQLRDKIPPGYPPLDIRKYRDARERGLGPAIRY